MEPSQLFALLLGIAVQIWPVWLLLLFALLAWFWRQPVVKGWRGERRVNRALTKKLPKGSYQLVKSVTLPTGDGTTQIDHVVLSPYGIFVIETKNMKGCIFGAEREAKWIQQINDYERSFQNPLRQNYKHTETLRQLLGLPKAVVHSVVIFAGEAELKTNMPKNVGSVEAGIKFIRSQRSEVFSADKVAKLACVLTEKRLEPGLKTHFRHVRHVKKLVKHKNLTKSLLDQGATESLCPRCHNELVPRKNRKTGETFRGCSDFPKCRFVAG